MAEDLYIQISRYSQPMVVLFGTFGALFNQILFQRKKFLRTASCSLYLHALSFNDLLVLYFLVLPQWSHDQFHTDLTNKYSWLCKIHTYTTYCLYAISPYCIVLVCIDRFCRTSKHTRIRNFATRSHARRILFSAVVLICLIYIHILFSYRLMNSICVPVNFSYYHFLGHFLFLFYCLLPPILMSIFSTWTFLLIRRRRRKHQRKYNLRIIRPRKRHYHRDYQLIKMLVLYVTTNIICTLPFAILLLLHVYHYQSNSSIIIYIKYSVLLCNVNYSTSFYIYTLQTPIYRRELLVLFQSTVSYLRSMKASSD